MADAFRGDFTALFVETPDFASMSGENRERLRQNTRLAQMLGAGIERVYGEDVALQISEFARISGVTKIVLGRKQYEARTAVPPPVTDGKKSHSCVPTSIFTSYPIRIHRRIVPAAVYRRGSRLRKPTY